MFETAQKQLDNLANLGDRISFPDMFPPQFMVQHSNFGTIEELFEKSGFKVESAEDFEAIPDNEWETFITQNTNFNSWEDMQKTAGNSLIKRTLNK